MTTKTTTAPAVLQGDEDQLFHTHARRLRSIVRMKVNTTDENIEDACAYAWMQLVRCQPCRDTVFAWLRTVAVNEAIRLHRKQHACPTCDIDGLEHPALRDLRCDPEAQDELIDALDALASLRDRQRLILGLYALGLRHKEIAEVTGHTMRSVGRQMVRARRAVRAQPRARN
jgi:RNA polymerase sigma factor (sigma-70 family)